MLNKDSFIHAHGSISERDLCHIQITPQYNSLKTRITPKIGTAFRYLNCKHSAFLRHEVIRALPKATVLSWL